MIFNNRIFQCIAAVVILILGVWLGTLFSGCNPKSAKPLVVQLTDTLVIDTSKIVYKTPIVINQVQAPTVDYYHDCWNALPMIINEHGDTLSIDSVNSCKGIFKGIHQNYKPDTVTYEKAEIEIDTVFEPSKFEFPSLTETVGNSLNFSVKAKAGSGFGMFAGIGIDAGLSYGRIGLTVQPSFYYIDKFRGFVFIGATYTLIGK